MGGEPGVPGGLPPVRPRCKRGGPGSLPPGLGHSAWNQLIL